ncbi:MAG: ribosome small subunit-dependent GTPase A [Thermoguttaceae bacterium]|nr:ribosome small subunit-dependent GTPase A [Thermoguttaceae bacterium]
MAKKRTFGDSEKFRVEFKRNRVARTRVSNWTRKYQEDASRQHLNKVGFEDVSDVELGERMSTRGEVVRKRTVVGSFVGRENLSGERGDFSVLPNVNPDICLKGRVLSVHGLISYVEDERGRVFACGIRRVLKTLATNQRQVVVAGDRVYFRDAKLPDGRLEGIIERIEPRYGALSRTSWSRKHVVVANVEQALIVASAMEPRIKPNLIDRLIVTCERSGIKPVVCINKIDLVDSATLVPLVGVYSRMGYQTVLFSAKTGFNLERLRRILVGKESVVVGQSGVGKSSALNSIDPTLNLKVGAVSHENDKGRHTTTTARLLKLNFGGYVVDTPGVRQFMLWDVEPKEVVGFYRDLRPYENLCKFPDCEHLFESTCAVKHSVADGRLDARRYESYLALRSGKMDKTETLE